MIKNGDKVKVEYEGMLDDGTIFDSSKKHGQPLEFIVGEGNVIKGFDNAVRGMKKGEEKKVKIKAKDAYGESNPQLIKKVPREQLPQKQEIKEEIILDLNHPLAGKDLTFKIKIVESS